MRKSWALILVLFSVNAATAQQTETRSIGSFSGVKVAEGVNVYLTKGDKESAKVEVEGTDLSNVITEISGSYLRVHMRDGRYRTVDAKVYVTYVKLDKLSASSAGSIYSDGPIQATDMEISASSAGSVEVILEVSAAEISASSAGDIELKGKARKISLNSSSAGEIDAYDLEAAQVAAEASSAGEVKVNVTENLLAHASSGGSIRYRGNPDKSVTNSTSGGSVRKSN